MRMSLKSTALIEKRIEINTYTIPVDSIKASYLIAIVTDLHERDYHDILETLCEIAPDFIFLPGDTLERREEGVQGHTKEEIDRLQNTSFFWKIVCRVLKLIGLNRHNDEFAQSGNGVTFLSHASEIAPIAMSVGNHEWYFTKEDYQLFENKGIIVLDNEDTEIKTNLGDCIRVGGLSTRYNTEWLQKYSAKSGCKILLCHHPEFYQNMIRNSKMDNFDLVISGHAHGGQVRLFDKGLFSPGQGFFPKYTKGLIKNHLISAGVSNTAFIPRIGNPREICLVRLKGHKDER